MNYKVTIELVNDEWSEMVVSEKVFEMLVEGLGNESLKYVLIGNDVENGGQIIDKEYIYRITYTELEGVKDDSIND